MTEADLIFWGVIVCYLLVVGIIITGALLR